MPSKSNNANSTMELLNYALSDPQRRGLALVDEENDFLLIAYPVTRDADGNLMPTKGGKKSRLAKTRGWGEPLGIATVGGIPRQVTVSLNAWA